MKRARACAERVAARRLLTEYTRITRTPLVPEIRLRLASEITPIWEATEEALDRHDTEPPFWAFAWAGGQALARYVLDHPESVSGRSVLDFASGCGVAGLAAALAGARRVVCVDIDPLAEAAVRAGAELNALEVDVLTCDIVGGSPPEGSEVVLAGDVCYAKAMSQRVLPWLRALARQGLRVLAGDPGRQFAPTGGLRELAVHDVPTTLELEDADVKCTAVWELLADAAPVDGAPR